jgi:hypothetical protein
MGASNETTVSAGIPFSTARRTARDSRHEEVATLDHAIGVEDDAMRVGVVEEESGCSSTNNGDPLSYVTCRAKRSIQALLKKLFQRRLQSNIGGEFALDR